MARTDVTPVALAGVYPGELTDLTWVAADPTNGNAVTLMGDEILLVRNDDTAGQLVTVSSVPDSAGRTGDVSATVAAGAYAVFGPVKATGWRQSDGKLYVDVASASVYLAVLKP